MPEEGYLLDLARTIHIIPRATHGRWGVLVGEVLKHFSYKTLMILRLRRMPDTILGPTHLYNITKARVMWWTHLWSAEARSLTSFRKLEALTIVSSKPHMVTSA